MVDRRWAAETTSAVAREMVTTLELAGLAVGVVKDGEIVYLDGFGLQSIETGAAITADSMFRVASVTKTLVATAIVQLVEEGKVRLEAPLVEYAPYFRLDDERYTQIRLSTPPGDRFSYSNFGYDLLGGVIAKVSGRGFEDYVEDRLLTPLNMHASTFRPERVDKRLEARPHLSGPHPILSPVVPQHPLRAPSGGLASNAHEMCNWAIVNLNQGRFGEEQILDSQSYGALWNPSAPSHGEVVTGLGWFLGEHRGRRIVQKGGSTTGYETSLILVPDGATAAVVMTTS